MDGMKYQVREGVFPGGLPYLGVGAGTPLVYLCGSTPDHRTPKRGVERAMTLRTIRPLARAGFAVYFTNRWPGMSPDITFAEVAARHADALGERFGEPVDVLGHSTGGSLLLQLLADRPEVVRRAVVASAAYALGPIAKRSQRELLHALEGTGRYSAEAIIDGDGRYGSRRLARRALSPLAHLAARRISVADPIDAIAMLRAEDAFDVRGRLSSIPTETLVIAGAQDGYWTLDMFAETAYRMPRGRLILYRQRGHALTVAPEFLVDVITFLRAPVGSDGRWALACASRSATSLNRDERRWARTGCGRSAGSRRRRTHRSGDLPGDVDLGTVVDRQSLPGVARSRCRRTRLQLRRTLCGRTGDQVRPRQTESGSGQRRLPGGPGRSGS
jgi:pimeloyl-ACP methyl ester carboxylesterase